jgi:hypothetical protein
MTSSTSRRCRTCRGENVVHARPSTALRNVGTELRRPESRHLVSTARERENGARSPKGRCPKCWSRKRYAESDFSSLPHASKKNCNTPNLCPSNLRIEVVLRPHKSNRKCYTRAQVVPPESWSRRVTRCISYLVVTAISSLPLSRRYRYLVVTAISSLHVSSDRKRCTHARLMPFETLEQKSDTTSRCPVKEKMLHACSTYIVQNVGAEECRDEPISRRHRTRQRENDERAQVTHPKRQSRRATRYRVIAAQYQEKIHHTRSQATLSEILEWKSDATSPKSRCHRTRETENVVRALKFRRPKCLEPRCGTSSSIFASIDDDEEKRCTHPNLCCPKCGPNSDTIGPTSRRHRTRQRVNVARDESDILPHRTHQRTNVAHAPNLRPASPSLKCWNRRRVRHLAATAHIHQKNAAHAPKYVRNVGTKE